MSFFAPTRSRDPFRRVTKSSQFCFCNFNFSFLITFSITVREHANARTDCNIIRSTIIIESLAANRQSPKTGVRSTELRIYKRNTDQCPALNFLDHVLD